MKVLITVFFLILYSNLTAQKVDQRFFDTARKNYKNPPLELLVVDGKVISREQFGKKYLHKNDILLAFYEGDSIYMKGMGYGKSVLQPYFGEDVKKGLLLLFTKEVLLNLKGKKMKSYLAQKKTAIFLKIYNLSTPISGDINSINSYNKNKIDSISIVSSIQFQKNDNTSEVRDFVMVFFSPKYLKRLKARLLRQRSE